MNNTVMMSWGDFVFSLPTLAFQDLARRTAWNWSQTPRVGVRAASQYIGPGDDPITLSGCLMPQVAGSASSLSRLRELGDKGEAWHLVSGDGTVHGVFVMLSVDERRTALFGDGTARKIDFTIELRRIDDHDALSASAAKTKAAGA